MGFRGAPLGHLDHGGRLSHSPQVIRRRVRVRFDVIYEVAMIGQVGQSEYPNHRRGVQLEQQPRYVGRVRLTGIIVVRHNDDLATSQR